MLCLGYCSDPNPHFDSHRVNQIRQVSTVPTPHFHSRTTSDCFGFHEPTHVVPLGTEPELQALNNPYIAERRAKERQLATLQVGRLTTTGILDPSTNTPLPDPEPNIDPCLLAKQHYADACSDERGSGDEYDSDGYHNRNEEDSFDESDEEHVHIRQHGSTGLI